MGAASINRKLVVSVTTFNNTQRLSKHLIVVMASCKVKIELDKAYKRADQAPELARASHSVLRGRLNAVSKRPGCPRPQIAFLLKFRTPGPTKT